MSGVPKKSALPWSRGASHRVARPALALLVFATGCGVLGLKGVDTGNVEEDTAGLTQSVSVVSIAPDRGPLNTATDVTIRGTGFTGDVVLAFGNTQVDVVVLSDTELLASTPEVPVEASVDITVTSDLGEAVMMNGFIFSDAATDDGGSGGSDDSGGTGTDNSGLVSAYVEHSYYVVGCPACLGYPDYVSLESFAVFHAPVAGSWFSWLPPQGTCTVNPSRSGPASSFLDVGSTVLLSAGTASRTLAKGMEGGMTYYASTTSDNGSFVRNTRYDLLAPYASPPIDAPGVLRTIPTGFTSIEPQAIFYDDYYAFPDFSASAAAFSWGPTSTADGVVIDIHLYDSTGSVYRGDIFCWVADNGYFQVPFADIATLAYEQDLAMIYYYKYTMSDGINPDDGSTIQAGSAFGGIGTATIWP
jgi:hypothetical protein